ncbi:MAG: anaerobic ribonucleoside-triphosphate reductase activating protein [bacterium]
MAGHEQKKIYGIKGFLETSFLDWPGRICAVIFLGGCNFRCPYCHNPDLVLHPEKLQDLAWQELKPRLLELGGWIDGVCITGGEPTLHARLWDLLEEIKALGLHVKLDTNGSRPMVLAELLRRDLVKAISMDVKAPLDSKLYRQAIGVDPPLDAISRSIEILGASSWEIEFRTTLVPGFLDEAQVIQMASFLPQGARYTLQGFKPGRSLDPELDSKREFSQEELSRLTREVKKLRVACA